MSDYHQVLIEPFDVWKTDFKSKKGLFKWLVMSFGWMNVPTTFMRLMDDILQPFTNSFMVVYLDDNMIFSHSWKENLHHIRQILQTMWKHKLCANFEKCTFGMTEVQYLGFVLGFSHITWPLSQVIKGGVKVKFLWYEYQQKVFFELKHCLYSAPILTLPDLQQPFEIEIDASDYAIGAILTQQGCPVAYHNETLSDTT
eukprot:PITA_35722